MSTERSASTKPLIESQASEFNEMQTDGEVVIQSFPANHTQGKRAVGGKLILTNRRLAFVPHRMELNMGGKMWELVLSDFSTAGIDKPRWKISEIFSGAWRTRMAIHAQVGEVQYFVVGSAIKVSQELSMAILTQKESAVTNPS